MSKKEVVKASGAIQMTNKISLLQRRTWNILLANAFDELLEEEEHRIEIKQLTNILAFSSKNEDHLRMSLKKLTTTAVEWNILRKDKSDIWGVTTLLSQVEIKDGMCTYAYSPALKKKLFQPSMYAKINLSMQNRFDSKHSLALYELCIDYYDVKRKQGETPFISVEDFRHLMGISDTEYMEFKYLNKRTVLEPIIEINAKSDIFVQVEYKRLGRKVSAIKFMIIAQNVSMNEDPQLLRKEQSPASEPSQPLSEIIDFLLLHGISQSKVNYFIKAIDFDVLLENINGVKEKISKKTIHYPKSYILTVLSALAGSGDFESTKKSKPKTQQIYDKEKLPSYLHFLLDDKILDIQTGIVHLPSENQTIYIDSLLQYHHEFWIRAYAKYSQSNEKNKSKAFEIAFMECQREEDFNQHPIYQLLLENIETKEDYQQNKIHYLSEIIKLYWQVVEKDISLDQALEKIK